MSSFLLDDSLIEENFNEPIKIECHHTKNYIVVRISQKDFSGQIVEINFENPLPKPFFELVSRTYDYFHENKIIKIYQTVLINDYNYILKDRTTWNKVIELGELCIITCNLDDLKKNFEIALLHEL
jgi:hypothetical protein